MNQLFNMNRFLLLVGKQWSENQTRYLLSILAVGGLLVIWLTFMFFAENSHGLDHETQVITYFGGLFLIGCLFASTAFSDLASKPKGINFLSLPASHFEKLLCALFYVVVLFPLVYSALFYIVDWIVLKYTNTLIKAVYYSGQQTVEDLSRGKLANVFVQSQMHKGGESTNWFMVAHCIFFAIQSAFIAGSIYFPKYSFIKTVVVLSIFASLFGLYIGKVLYPMMPHGNFETPTTFSLFNKGYYGTVVSLPAWVDTVLIFLLKFSVPPVFYVTTYFRLKEKEV